jgi:ATP-dependent Clp protease ATP-binding subunit ClpX (EC 3.4.21.92)
MEGILLETMYELPNLEDVTEVVISADVDRGKAKPIYVYGERL